MFCGVLLGINARGQLPTDRAESRYRAQNEARFVAAKVDMYFQGLETLLIGLSMALSTNPSDVDANDLKLRRLKYELPGSIANIFLLSLNGQNIGNAVGQHASAGDREYFKGVIAGAPLMVGPPVRSRSTLGPVIPVARPIRNGAGETRAVLVVATSLEGFGEVIGINELPMGSVIKIVNDQEVEIATISNAPGATHPHF